MRKAGYVGSAGTLKGSHRIYSYSDIEQATNCLQVARELGANIEGDRCNAAWRNGKNLNVKIDENRGTTTKQASAEVLFSLWQWRSSMDAQQAQEHLGDRFKLTPKYGHPAKAKPRRRTRAPTRRWLFRSQKIRLSCFRKCHSPGD